MPENTSENTASEPVDVVQSEVTSSGPVETVDTLQDAPESPIGVLNAEETTEPVQG